MNYYGALQRKDTLRWDYTKTNDGKTWPVGYCRGWEERTEEELIEKFGTVLGKGIYKDQEKERPDKDRYHVDGHETKAEACECYKQYVLDHHMRLDAGQSPDTQHRCEVAGCEGWTQTHAVVDMHPFYLCDEHRNRETLEKLYSVGESWSSY